MEATPLTQQRYVRKASDAQCMICVENIEYYAIGQCGHNLTCWKCSLKQRMKLEKKECPICKQVNTKLLITRNKYDTLETCLTSIYDPETDLHFENPSVKTEVQRRVGFFCKMCTGDPIRKFPTLSALANHYEKSHRKLLCQLCLDHKPVLMFEQKLYEFGDIMYHDKKNHPLCHFCYNQRFYDQDALNKHYYVDHHFCEVCKRLGRKRVQKSTQKNTNMPEYEVYRDILELRKHQEREHYVCTQPVETCRLLVFETGASLSAHYLNAHGIRKPVRLEFDNTEEEEEYGHHHQQQQHQNQQQEEEKKEQNVKITKDNYREIFPTLGQTSKNAQPINRPQESWPSLTQQIQGLSHVQSRPQTSKPQQKKSKQQAPQVQDRVSIHNHWQQQQRDRAQVKKIEQMVDHMADSQFEYREEQDYINIENLMEETKTPQIAKPKAANNNNGGGGGKKMKKIIVEKKPDPVEEEKDYPDLIQARPQTAASQQNNTAAWNLITTEKIKKAEEKKQPQKQERINPYIDKQQFPTLPRDQKPQKEKKEDPGGGGEDNKDGIGSKKNKKKKAKGQHVVDWTILEKPIDYNSLF